VNRKFQIYLFCLLTWGLAACSVTRHLDEDELLLNRVKFEGVDHKDLKAGLRDYLVYTDNKKILDIYPFYLQAWNFGLDGRDSNRVRTFVREKIGEKPNLLDSSKLDLSSNQLEIYLFNNGYFNAKVDYKVRTRRKKAFVTYTVDLNAPYRIADIEYRIYDRDLHKLLMLDTSDRRFESGDVVNTEKMSEERDRIASYVRNNGYFFFDKQYIAFDVDSNQGNHTINMAIEVKNPGMYKRHETYQFNDVYVDISYPYYLEGKDDSTYTEIDGIYVRTHGMPISKQIFADYIKVRPGIGYSDKLVLGVYNRLYGLQIFSALRLEMNPDTANKLIDMFVVLIPDPSMKFSVEPQVITSDQSSSAVASNQRIWGLSGQVLFRHKNTFGGAELFDVTYSGATEFQYTNRKFVLSNMQQSLSNSLVIPKFLWIHDWNWIQQVGKAMNWKSPTTTFNLTFSYQYNPDFIQRTSLINFSYAVGGGFNFFRFVPLEWNLNQVTIKSNFLDSLSPGDRVLLSSLLNPNFIPSTRFEWYYKDKGLSSTGNYHKFRLNVETAGNAFYTGFVLSGTPKPSDGIYKIFNTNLFQFAKGDFDMSYYMNTNSDVNIAYRLHTGLAFPYGNSRVVPFDKRFFIGGANSLRGWAPRNVGPGTYTSVNANQIDRSGEVVIEGSAEVRFRVIRELLEGALFVDGGNIWNVHPDNALPGAEFSLLFFNQFALNAGIGARFDFGFFLVRLDMGAQIRDPSYHKNGGIVLQDFNYLNRRLTFNFGIGYPF